MLVLISTIKAKKGCENELMKKLKELIPHAKKEEGTIAYSLNVSKDDDNKFVFYEKYPDQAAFDTHLNSDYLQKFLKEDNYLLECEPKLDFYEEIDSI